MNIRGAVFPGGGIGSLLRHRLARLMWAPDLRGILPWATFVANLMASVMLAIVVLRMRGHFQQRPALAAFITVGVRGGSSTLSTFSCENFLRFREGLALANVAVNVLACGSMIFLLARQA